MKFMFIFFTVLLVSISQANSQSLSVFDVDATNFPIMSAKFYAFDEEGNQIRDFQLTDFKINEDNEPRQVISVRCPPENPPIAISSVLAIDVSGSMAGNRTTMAKAAANAWINALPLGQSECCITTFNTRNYYLQDFTTDKNKLLNAVCNLNSSGGTEFDAGFIDSVAGGILAAKNGKYKRVLVFLTDGYGTGSQNEIISQAIANNITVFCVTLGFHCPEILKEIAEQTGGQWFENITSIPEAEQIYRNILILSQNLDPCTIVWESEYSCNSKYIHMEMTLKKNGSQVSADYQIPNKGIARLEFNPDFIDFLESEPGVPVEKTISVTARGADFNVKNISSSNPAFSFSPNSFFLANDQSINLKLTFHPVDSGYVFSKFEFENDLCSKIYYARGGWVGKSSIIRTIKLIHPNGDEKLFVGSDTVITWDGVHPDELVSLEYSTDNGTSWKLISNNISGLNYKWKVPDTPSGHCLARVTSKSKFLFLFEELLICEQIWMSKNLNISYYRNGDTLRQCRTIQEWHDAGRRQEGAYCYYKDDEKNSSIYGLIYNIYAILDPRGLAPDGWHIPNDNDWDTLKDCELVNGGGGLKSTGTLESGDGLWRVPNIGATNATGFNGLPGGWLGFFPYTGFEEINEVASWWSLGDPEEPESYQYYYISHDSNYFGSLPFLFNVIYYGYYVRCILD
jgi:uncharacterized protein (TIGR02145 family)